MKYYHGSSNGELTKLTLNKSNDGYIYLTPDYATAVFYGGAPIRFWAWNNQTQKLVVREMCKNCLKKLYKGKSCYVYATENVVKFKTDNYKGRPAIKLAHDVTLEEKEFIPDVYKKLLQLERSGELEIFRWKNHTKQQKLNEIEGIKLLINKTDPQKYPQDWQLLCTLYPHLCAKIKK